MSNITKESLMSSLPSVLANDTRLNALASAVADILSTRVTEVESLAFYKRIDELPERLLDILAYDFKIDWWSQQYSVDEKRKILKSNWHIHKMMGTKAAVERGISDIYDDTQVVEWFDYKGKPYHFKVEIDASYQDTDPVKYNRVIEQIRMYKNLRSILDSVEFVQRGTNATEYAYTSACGQSLTESAIAYRY